MEKQEVIKIIIEFLSLLVLAITGVVVWIYTKAAQKSNEISERPIINLELEENFTGFSSGGVTTREFSLVNVGSGPAYNVQISDIAVSDYVYHPKFNEPTSILNKDEKKVLSFWLKHPDGGVEQYDVDRFLLRLFVENISSLEEYEEAARKRGVFVITYENISGDTYYSVFRFYSKLRPLPDNYDLIIEFIKNGKGLISTEKAQKICKEKPIYRGQYEN